jgi:RNA polymerase sigma factor (sigma-70 family)
MRVHDSDVSVPPASGIAIPDASSDVAWVSEAYGSFADALYAYCRSLVHEPAAAADALRDTFVVTALRLDDLPAEGLLRPWLYAVARNECLRAISGGLASAAADFLPNEAGTDGRPLAQLPSDEEAGLASDAAGSDPGAPDETSADVMSAEAEDVRALLRTALGGLDAADRDLMIMAWHGLDITESAFVLGVSRDAVFKSFARARDHLDQCAGALIVARLASRECEQLSAMLDGWDGRLTPTLSSALHLHIDHCAICGNARRGGPSPALVQLSPDAMRTMAVTAGTSRLTKWVTSRLRDQVLAAAFDQELESFEHRAMVVRRAGPFRGDGFPIALSPGPAADRKRRSPLVLVLAGAGGTGLAALVAVAALAVSGNHSTGILQAWVGLSHPTVTTSGANAALSRSPGSSGAASATPSAKPTAKPATPSATPGSKPSATKSSPAPPSSTATASGPASSSPIAPPTTAAVVQAGLSVSTTSLTLQQHWGGYGGTLTLTNPTGSAISWSISIPGSSHLAVWGQTSGQLQPRQQTTLYIYLDSRAANQPSTAVITIDPGTIQVSVTIP